MCELAHTAAGVKGGTPFYLDTHTFKSKRSGNNTGSLSHWERRKRNPHANKSVRAQLASSLEAIGESAKAKRVKACGSRARVVISGCGGGPARVVPDRCGVAGCPSCDPIEARLAADRLATEIKAVSRYQTTIKKGPKHYEPRHLVLTYYQDDGTPAGGIDVNDPVSVRAACDHLWKSLGKLWRQHLRYIDRAKANRGVAKRRWVKNEHVGIIAFLELSGRSGRPHLHCLWFGPFLSNTTRECHVCGSRLEDTEGNPLPGLESGECPRCTTNKIGWLSRTWSEISGASVVYLDRLYHTVNGQRVHGSVEHGAREIAKYLTAPTKKAPENLRQTALIATNRKRRHRAYGAFVGKPLAAALAFHAATQPRKVCRWCGQSKKECGEVATALVDIATARVVAACANRPWGPIPAVFYWFVRDIRDTKWPGS